MSGNNAYNACSYMNWCFEEQVCSICMQDVMLIFPPSLSVYIHRILQKSLSLMCMLKCCKVSPMLDWSSLSFASLHSSSRILLPSECGCDSLCCLFCQIRDIASYLKVVWPKCWDSKHRAAIYRRVCVLASLWNYRYTLESCFWGSL